ncbi:uncharacterized protein BDV17DRAFT_185643 [Aspergillus undulatus]|uniref:uncharacterized protein n=1 Tax=Aspergillus undulatus TaxID=1810928 RepID=UPI003CCD6190
MVAFHRIKSPSLIVNLPFPPWASAAFLCLLLSCLVLPFRLPNGGDCRWLVLWLFNLSFLPELIICADLLYLGRQAAALPRSSLFPRFRLEDHPLLPGTYTTTRVSPPLSPVFERFPAGGCTYIPE